MHSQIGLAHKLADKLELELSVPLLSQIQYRTKKKSQKSDSRRLVNAPNTYSQDFHTKSSAIDDSREQGQGHENESNLGLAHKGQSFEDIVISNNSKDGPSDITSNPEALDGNVKYSRILVPHDGSDASDTALSHAIYLSKMSDAEIIILHVVEKMHDMNSSAVTAMSKEQSSQAKHDEVSNANEEFDIRVEGEVKHMIEEKIGLCKNAGVKSQVSYKVQTGKPVEEIVKSAEHMNVDLIVMASRRSSSIAKRILGSTSIKVLDGVKKPALIIHV
jgi:nucleotide-binding universal stress UspA family protein